MSNTSSHKPQIFGTATIGTKGQIVIPSEARNCLSLKTGDKVVVIGLKKRGIIALCPMDCIEDMFATMAKHLEEMRQEITKAQEKNKEES